VDVTKHMDDGYDEGLDKSHKATHIRVGVEDIIVSKDDSESLEVFQMLPNGDRWKLTTYYIEDCDDEGEPIYST